MNKKKVLYFLISILPIVTGYGVFAILLSLFSKVPGVGQQIVNLWYIPFSIISFYMFYTALKDFRSAKQNN